MQEEKQLDSSTPMDIATAQVKACLADVAKNENYISIIEQKKKLMKIKLEREQVQLKRESMQLKKEEMEYKKLKLEYDLLLKEHGMVTLENQNKLQNCYQGLTGSLLRNFFFCRKCLQHSWMICSPR